jgi:hypothetical protein
MASGPMIPRFASSANAACSSIAWASSRASIDSSSISAPPVSGSLPTQLALGNHRSPAGIAHIPDLLAPRDVSGEPAGQADKHLVTRPQSIHHTPDDKPCGLQPVTGSNVVRLRSFRHDLESLCFDAARVKSRSDDLLHRASSLLQSTQDGGTAWTQKSVKTPKLSGAA